MTETIKTLLQTIQNRLNAATPGPWTDYDRGIGHEIHGQFGAINSRHRETFSARDAEFIAAAPTDQARLLAAVQAVTAIHEHEDAHGWGSSQSAQCVECQVNWPCATVAAIESALTEAR